MKGDASKHEKSGDEQDTSTTKPDKTRQKSGLTQKQYNAIDALLAGATDQEAANKSGVSRPNGERLEKRRPRVHRSIEPAAGGIVEYEPRPVTSFS